MSVTLRSMTTPSVISTIVFGTLLPVSRVTMARSDSNDAVVCARADWKTVRA